MKFKTLTVLLVLALFAPGSFPFPLPTPSSTSTPRPTPGDEDREYHLSIMLPFWQDDVNTYSMFILVNTSKTTSDTIAVQFYGKTGNAQQGTAVEKTIAPRNVEVFGSGRYPGELKIATSAPYGYALATNTDGSLFAIGIIYDDTARSGYVIPTTIIFDNDWF